MSPSARTLLITFPRLFKLCATPCVIAIWMGVNRLLRVVYFKGGKPNTAGEFSIPGPIRKQDLIGSCVIIIRHFLFFSELSLKFYPKVLVFASHKKGFFFLLHLP